MVVLLSVVGKHPCQVRKRGEVALLEEAEYAINGDDFMVLMVCKWPRSGTAI